MLLHGKKWFQNIIYKHLCVLINHKISIVPVQINTKWTFLRYAMYNLYDISAREKI